PYRPERSLMSPSDIRSLKNFIGFTIVRWRPAFGSGLDETICRDPDGPANVSKRRHFPKASGKKILIPLINTTSSAGWNLLALQGSLADDICRRGISDACSHQFAGCAHRVCDVGVCAGR